MKTFRPPVIGLIAFSTCIVWCARVEARAASIADLKTQIQECVSQHDPAAAADQKAMDRLNGLKVELMKALAREIDQLERGTANATVSDAVQRAIANNRSDYEKEMESLARSMNTWNTGLIESHFATEVHPPDGDGVKTSSKSGNVTRCINDVTEIHLAKPVLTQTTTTADGKLKTTYVVSLPGKTTAAVSISVCVDGVRVLGEKVSAGSEYTKKLSDVGGKAGSVITAQIMDEGSTKYGPVSEEVAIGECSADWHGDSRFVPVIETVNRGVITGSVAPGSADRVRICAGDKQVTVVRIQPDGSFAASLRRMPRGLITAQLITSDPAVFPRVYGAPSKGIRPLLYGDSLSTSFIGGIEQSGYSSQANSTNAFLYAYFQGPYFLDSGKRLNWSLWGRIRLLGGPSPSPVSVVAAVANPQGVITSTNLSSVGQVVDYVIGPVVRIYQHDGDDASANRVSLIAGLGATTPLGSTNIQYSLQAPQSDSAQCLQLLSLYSGLANGSTAPKCTLVNALTGAEVKTISFAPLDRTNFLLKYGAGVRFSHMYPAKGDELPYAGSMDLVIGQDESVTGGGLHGVVFKMDGTYPLAFGASSYFYIFGSAAMRITGNKNANPVVLGTASTPGLPLQSTVALLPLKQPDRDFYRFGVGLNIAAIYCKFSGPGCPATEKSGTAKDAPESQAAATGKK